MEIRSILIFGVFQRSIQSSLIEENNIILLRKVNFAFMIPNPSLDCSYVVLNFRPNLSLVPLKKKACITVTGPLQLATHTIQDRNFRNILIICNITFFFNTILLYIEKCV